MNQDLSGQNTGILSQTNATKTNPYLNNPELNYLLDKAKRSYEDLTLRYNLPEWKDLSNFQSTNTQFEEMISNEQSEPQVFQNYIPSPDLTSANQPILNTSSSAFSSPFLTQTQPTAQNTSGYDAESLINATKLNLKTIGSDANESYIQHGSSPETPARLETQTKTEDKVESKVEVDVENATNDNPPANPTTQKISEEEKVEPPKSKVVAETIASMIGKIKLYGYTPSPTIINKIARSKDPQTVWKVLPTGSAKSWLYALTGRLIAIHTQDKK